jgi:hypothetical protein
VTRRCPRCGGFVTYDRRLRFETDVYCVNCGWREGEARPPQDRLAEGFRRQMPSHGKIRL